MKQLIQHALEGLDEPRREFIKSCLQEEPSLRPRATSLLKQAVLQEVRVILYGFTQLGLVLVRLLKKKSLVLALVSQLK